MKKALVIALSLGMILSAVACGQKSEPAATTAAPAPAQTEAATTAAAPAAAPAAAETGETLKIAYLVSDMKETFHQASYEAAKEYAKEKYGADVIAFDGAGDAADQIAMLDQFGAQGIDMATMHVWENDAALPALKELLDDGVICASFFGPIPGSGVPAVRNDEAGVSKAMAIEMAKDWVAAHPDEKIVCVELGWPNHEQVRTGRTDPFIEGIKEVVGDDFTDLGCLESTGGADDAKASMAGVLNSNPEVNLIYAESGGICKGVLSALQDAGRGVLNEDGTPKTELVCTCDFDETQFYQIYGDDSLIASLGLSPIETGRARIDYLFQIKDGTIPQISEPEAEYFCSASCISAGSMTPEETAKWLQDECNVTPKMDQVKAAAPAKTDEGLRIAYLVSDMKETFHQASYEAAKEYAKDQYGSDVIAFDGAGDAADQIAMLDQFGAQGIDMATMHVWENDAALPALKELLDEGVVCASFFGPIPGSGVPAVRNDEAAVSKAMAVEMAEAWVAAHPDEKIVCVELGWPNHEQVRTGRTDPFIEGIKEVVGDDFTDLGCLESTGGADDAKASMAGVLNSNPEVNLIYAESGGICKGVLSALQDAGRGVLNDDGTPKTELVCTCDFDETQFYQIYGNDSLIASLGLSPIETGRARIDYLFKIKNGEIPQISEPEAEYFCSASCISIGSMTKEETAKWLQDECNVTPKMD